ncbi:MAG: MBL fold metallo-hydrolase [Clostridiales bacterium]|nr:MBL fold metallo-hydrolase [Clostridiales bacterium]
MLITTIQLGPNEANCYIVIDEKTGSSAVIDPGGYEKRLTTKLSELSIEKLELILLTHGHYDHVLGVYELKQTMGAKIAIHKNDALCLEDDKKSLAFHVGDDSQKYIKADISFEDGMSFAVGETLLTVMHTPGHTQGSVCFICEAKKVIFSGDTLFKHNVGRTDLPGGSMTELLASMNKLSALKGNYDIYPGHGPKTTLDDERNNNAYMGMTE